MASPVLGAFAGLARGFERGMERGRARNEQRRQEDRADQLREFALLYPKAMEAAELTGDYASVEDFIGNYFPTTKAKTSARRATAKAGAPKVTPPSLAPAPTGEYSTAIDSAPAAAPMTTGVAAAPVAEPATAPTDIATAMPGAAASAQTAQPTGDQTASPPAMIPSRAAVSPGTPPPTPSPQQDFFGFTMPTPAARRQMQVDAEISSLEQTRLAQAALARRILPKLQADDPSITLEDAMRYVTKGDLMSNAAQRAGSMYRYGVDREALAKAIFGKAYEQLDRVEADIVIREEQSMLQKESEARGTGTATARFNAPMTADQAQSVGAPVGTSSAQLSGQVVPTTQEKDRRRSVEELQTNLAHIRDNLLVALPSKNELQGLAPGLAFAARRRLSQYREPIAALESAINNSVNVMARSVGEQRGTQTERDALRAEAAIAQIRDAFLTGDTRESAVIRINESLRILDNILGRLPAAVAPTAKPAAAAGSGGSGGSGSPAAPASTGMTKGADGVWRFN